jgi:hypothetical protein
MSSSQKSLPDNTQHSKQAIILATSGIRTHDLSRRPAADIHLRPRVHWDRQLLFNTREYNETYYGADLTSSAEYLKCLVATLY